MGVGGAPHGGAGLAPRVPLPTGLQPPPPTLRDVLDGVDWEDAEPNKRGRGAAAEPPSRGPGAEPPARRLLAVQLWPLAAEFLTRKRKKKSDHQLLLPAPSDG